MGSWGEILEGETGRKLRGNKLIETRVGETRERLRAEKLRGESQICLGVTHST